MSTRVKAGRMRDRIDVMDATVTRDIVGGVVLSDQVLYSCNAQIIPLSSKEILNGRETQGYATHRIIMRYNKEHPLKSKQFLRKNTRIFEIESIADMDDRRRKYVLLVKETIE